MKTIQWIVSLIPTEMRALFSVLLIAISCLASCLIFMYNKLDTITTFNRNLIDQLTIRYDNKIDSLNRVILTLKDDSKKEIIDRLDGIIKDQKQEIHSRKATIEGQEFLNKKYNNIIKKKGI